MLQQKGFSFICLIYYTKYVRLIEPMLSYGCLNLELERSMGRQITDHNQNGLIQVSPSNLRGLVDLVYGFF